MKQDSEIFLGPYVTLPKFTKTSGVPAGVLRGWCDRGLIKTIKIGKHLLIDMSSLKDMAKNRWEK